MADRRQQFGPAVVGAGGMAALFVAYQIATGIMSRATGEYVQLPDRVAALEVTTARHVEYIAEQRAEAKAAQRAARKAADALERRTVLKERLAGEARRDERLEKILQAIASCNEGGRNEQ